MSGRGLFVATGMETAVVVEVRHPRCVELKLLLLLLLLLFSLHYLTHYF
jgi:hypothetical protein